MPKMQLTMTFHPDAISYTPRGFGNSSYSAPTSPSSVVYSQKIQREKVYLAISTALLNSLSNPPYSAPALSYNSTHPALAISRLTSLLNTPHLQTLTEQTIRSYLS